MSDNLQNLNAGTVANDGTGDTLRSGSIKINENFRKLATYVPVRHRQSALEYPKDSTGKPNFITFVGRSGSLSIPFIGSCMESSTNRGELNIIMCITSSASNVYTVPPSSTGYLYIRTDENRNISYVVSTGSYTDSYVEPSASNGDFWVDRLNYALKFRTGSQWEQSYSLMIGKFVSDASSVTSFEYNVSNEEYEEAKKLSIKYSLIFG